MIIHHLIKLSQVLIMDGLGCCLPLVSLLLRMSLYEFMCQKTKLTGDHSIVNKGYLEVVLLGIEIILQGLFKRLV